MLVDELGPFVNVLDVGGNVGEFAELCKQTWPESRVTSFEPVPKLARANEQRAGGRWAVENIGLSDHSGREIIRYCVNQHSASTLLESGPTRRELFGIRDTFEPIEVKLRRLDEAAPPLLDGRTLLKVDVEGHELAVLRGGVHVLEHVDVAIVEVNQAPVFVGQPTFDELDVLLRFRGLSFVGVAGVQTGPHGRGVVQFDGIWRRR
jgi:FkbM family methyltransferase